MPVIVIDGIIGDEVKAASVRAQLAEAKGMPVTVEISSVGGSIAEGLAIYNLIYNYPGKKQTRVIGFAASMASYIALAADYVEVHDNAVFMVHNSRAGTFGDSSDMMSLASTLAKMDDLLSEAYQKKVGKTREEVKALMDAETYLFGAEIVEAGFADAVVGTESGETREDAVAFAAMSLEDCSAKMREKLGAEDLTKAAALLMSETTGAAQKPQAPTANENPQGASKMTLEELLAANPEAKAEFEAKLAVKVEPKAEEKPKEEPKAEAVNALALRVLKSSEYAAQVKDVAAEVLEGKAEASTLRAVVAVADMYAEKEKSAEAQDQTQKTGETPAAENEDKGIDGEGKITSAKGLSYAAAQMKELRKEGGK